MKLKGPPFVLVWQETKRRYVCYLVEMDVDTLVVVGVETLDDVDTDDDVDTELDVDTLR